jgi:uncharacterized FlaG/YvyC family protein
MDPMSDKSIQPIGTVSAESTRNSGFKPDDHQERVRQPEPTKTQAPMSSFPGNTHLVFEVNAEDKSITVMIVDESSSKVIRTIPLEAIKNISSGELFKRSA